MGRYAMFVVVALLFLAPQSVGAQVSPSDTGPLLSGTKVVAIGLGIVTVLLSVLLYLLPLRAAAATKRRVETAIKEQVLTLQEEDRRRIARELHDGAGQALTAARLQLIALRANEAVPHDLVRQIIASVDGAIDEIRRSTSALAPPALAELGLLGALARHCDQFAGAAGLSVRLDAPPTLKQLPAYVETAIYRIVQEGLTNVARHAGARRAWVSLIAGPTSIQLEVGDDGAGIEEATPGFGFDSIRQRARLAGGACEILGSPGPGARLRVVLPLLADIS
jgi:two-component system sensor histidine kinase UhpB